MLFFFYYFFFFLMIRRPPRSTLFPYTTSSDLIGLPGDTVACCDPKGRVYVNGYALDEPYVTDDSSLDAPPAVRECRSRRFGPITVETGQMFVMGDHRLVSQDSRCQGQVPIDHVICRAFVIVWPSGRWDWLTVPATFSN